MVATVPPPRWWPPALLLEDVGSQIALRGRCPRGAPALAAWPGPIWPCRWWPCQGLGASPSRWISFSWQLLPAPRPPWLPWQPGGTCWGRLWGHPGCSEHPQDPTDPSGSPRAPFLIIFPRINDPGEALEAELWFWVAPLPPSRDRCGGTTGVAPRVTPSGSSQRWCPLPWVTTSHRRGSGGTGDTAGVVSPPPPHPRPSAQQDRWGSGMAPKIPDPGELGA